MPIQPMYFQPLSFDQANPFLTGMKSGEQLVGGLLNNQATALANQLARTTLPYAAPSAQAQLLAAQLANQTNQLKMPFVVPEAQADLAYKQAQTPYLKSQTDLTGAEAAKTRMLMNNPLLNMGGAAGQLGAYMYLLQQQGKLPPTGNQQTNNNGIPASIPANMVPSVSQPAPTQQPANAQQDLPSLLMNSLTAGMRKTNAQADYLGKRASGYNYLSLPVDQRDAIIAQTSGMGYDPTQASALLMQGKSLEDLARDKGFDPQNMPEPIYPATKGALTQIQKRQQGLAEVNKLNPILTEWMAPYAQRFNGYSPKQISQAMSGDSSDQQAKYLAAAALIPEMSALRARTMGANVGVEVVKEITNASMNNIKSFQSLVNPEVYKKANKYIDQALEQAVTAANSAGLKTYGKNNQLADSVGQSDPVGIR